METPDSLPLSFFFMSAICAHNIGYVIHDFAVGYRVSHTVKCKSAASAICSICSHDMRVCSGFPSFRPRSKCDIGSRNTQICCGFWHVYRTLCSAHMLRPLKFRILIAFERNAVSMTCRIGSHFTYFVVPPPPALVINFLLNFSAISPNIAYHIFFAIYLLILIGDFFGTSR